MTGSQIVPAAQKRVWEALNDVEILRRCVPGCESIEQDSPAEFRSVVVRKIGAVSARFKGKLTITDADPPNGYNLAFEGQGGMAGFAKGTAAVALRSLPEGTELTYTAHAQVGGKLAQIGSRLVDMVAKSTADEFFKNFGAAVIDATDSSPAEHRAGEAKRHSPPPRLRTLKGRVALLCCVTAVAVAALAILYYLR
jgi:carbon monoxide dehydrogenase subunit G